MPGARQSLTPTWRNLSLAIGNRGPAAIQRLGILFFVWDSWLLRKNHQVCALCWQGGRFFLQFWGSFVVAEQYVTTINDISPFGRNLAQTIGWRREQLAVRGASLLDLSETCDVLHFLSSPDSSLMIEVLVLGLEYDMLKVMQVPPLALFFWEISVFYQFQNG